VTEVKDNKDGKQILGGFQAVFASTRELLFVLLPRELLLFDLELGQPACQRALGSRHPNFSALLGVFGQGHSHGLGDEGKGHSGGYVSCSVMKPGNDCEHGLGSAIMSTSCMQPATASTSCMQPAIMSTSFMQPAIGEHLVHAAHYHEHLMHAASHWRAPRACSPLS
jgi:hypothetical protein